MALLDDPAFIISHLRHSFITSDDTGMCEMAIMNEDLDWKERKQEALERRKKPWSQYYSADPDQEDLDIFGESYEIEASSEYGFRQRSNTAVRLEKLRSDRMAQKKCKRIQWKGEAYMEFPEEDLDELFSKRKFLRKRVDLSDRRRSILSAQLEQNPNQANNPFSEYSKFDGKAHSGGSNIKKIDIYLAMCEGDAREFPLTIYIMGNAKVLDLIGLICWHYTNDGYQPKLRENVESYCLMIAEEDGEVDTDFPALDNREAFSKFGFNTLALVPVDMPEDDNSEESKPEGCVINIKSSDGESKVAVDNLSTTLREILVRALRKRKGVIPTAGPDYILERDNQPGVALDLDTRLCDMTSFDLVMVREHSKREYPKPERTRHVSTAEPPLVLSTQYKSYRINMLHRLRPTTEIQLGVSGDKIEIDPVSQPKTTAAKFWSSKQKAVSIDTDRLAACALTDEKPSGKTVFRLTYKSISHEFKHRDFETDHSSAKQIVSKINQILELRASAVRNDYTIWKDRRHSTKRHHDR
ncbi:target of rapamycin complex 2 subunit MAPKAP1-like [Asterias amurensis]|uniref:target of rapamycin complex 2 subunit MAPKAP1-like n=1 Tax=Asterias amurensis TaxID=7602 RepID=UPI003AB5432E